jgi:organic radical activating enzyme
MQNGKGSKPRPTKYNQYINNFEQIKWRKPNMKISELFYSIQAEGATTGIPSFFIRLPNCNLSCGLGNLFASGKATWVCDSAKLWKESKEYSFDDIIQKFIDCGQLDNIVKGYTHIVWTGGEVNLVENRKNIMEFLDYFYEKYPFGMYNTYNEVETNGTIECDDGFYSYIKQINCSPKLANSGMLKEKRINQNAIEQIKYNPNHWFKFVITSENDIQEIENDFIKPFQLDKESIILMPACDKREDLPKMMQLVWKIGMQTGYRICSRLQILTFDKQIGV